MRRAMGAAVAECGVLHVRMHVPPVERAQAGAM